MSKVLDVVKGLISDAAFVGQLQLVKDLLKLHDELSAAPQAPSAKEAKEAPAKRLRKAAKRVRKAKEAKLSVKSEEVKAATALAQPAVQAASVELASAIPAPQVIAVPEGAYVAPAARRGRPKVVRPAPAATPTPAPAAQVAAA